MAKLIPANSWRIHRDNTGCCLLMVYSDHELRIYDQKLPGQPRSQYVGYIDGEIVIPEGGRGVPARSKLALRLMAMVEASYVN